MHSSMAAISCSTSVVRVPYMEEALIFQHDRLARDTPDKLNETVGTPAGDELHPHKSELLETPVRPRHDGRWRAGFIGKAIRTARP